ncbi:class I SAM-dependent methyltransferase [Streptomyces shenzhenensis]|uniref:class I SAM-dependent methyltransferase n=1 Tax=Streptomyces shenzhenensis TaxID=943815 RepID=UPI0036A4949F
MKDSRFSDAPNPALAEEISSLAPGTALDAGCGEGADAIWLAGQGWQVTGVDISAPALARAAADTPTDLAGRATWEKADVTDWQPTEAPLYNLVTVSYLKIPIMSERRRVFTALAARVALDGHLVLIGHHPGGPPSPGLFYIADGLAADLPDRSWEIITRGLRPRPSTSPDGTSMTGHDTVFTARRTR